jgi:hypothetical protein
VELTLADASPTGVFSAGFRGMPAVASNANRNLALTDCGKCVYKNNATAYTYTIDPDATTAYPVGSAIMVLNDGTTTNITVARGAGVALVNSAGTNANVTVAPNSNVTLYKVSANRWRALGA